MDNDDGKCKSSQRTDMVWFKPIDNSLAKLNRVRANMYNMELTEMKTATPVDGISNNGDRPFRRTGSHNDLRLNISTTSGHPHSEPSSPVFKVPSQKNAWTSSSSIPDLVNLLSARLRSRPTSSLRHQLTRPRPLNCRQQSARGRPPLHPFTVAVRGNSCQLSGRHQQTDRSDDSHDTAYSRFNGGLYYDQDAPTAVCGTSDDDTTIPPPPRCSPDLGLMVDTLREKIDAVGRSSFLPSTPIHLSLPVAEMESSVEIDTLRLIEDDDLYAPLNAHKASDAAQSSFRCASCDTVNERSDIDAATALQQNRTETVKDALEDIKSFHGYNGPAEDMRLKISRNKVASSAVVQPSDDTARSLSSKSRKKRHLHGHRRSSVRLRQVVTTLSERQKNNKELLKQSMLPDETKPDGPTSETESVPVVSLVFSDKHSNKSQAALTAARKTSEVEAMIQRLQVNLTAGEKGGEGGEGEPETTHYTNMPCEPVLLTRIVSKRTPNYYEYARKTTPPKKSPRHRAREKGSTPTVTLELAGHAITEQKVHVEEQKIMANVTELQNVSQDSAKMRPGLPLPPRSEGSRLRKARAQSAGLRPRSPGIRPRSPGEAKAVVSMRQLYSRRVRAASARARGDSQDAERCHVIAGKSSQPQRVQSATIAPHRVQSAPVGLQRVMSAPEGRWLKVAECHENKETVAPVKLQLPYRRVSDTEMISRGNMRKDSSKRRNTITNSEPSIPAEVIEIWTRRNGVEVETKGTEECREMQQRLLEKNIPISLDTLTRALLPPTEYAHKTPSYHSTAGPILPSCSSGLLSSPSIWLTKEYDKVRQAEKAVRLATEILDEQKMAEADVKVSKLRIKSAPPRFSQKRL